MLLLLNLIILALHLNYFRLQAKLHILCVIDNSSCPVNVVARWLIFVQLAHNVC